MLVSWMWPAGHNLETLVEKINHGNKEALYKTEQGVIVASFLVFFFFVLYAKIPFLSYFVCAYFRLKTWYMINQFQINWNTNLFNWVFVNLSIPYETVKVVYIFLKTQFSFPPPSQVVFL